MLPVFFALFALPRVFLFLATSAAQGAQLFFARAPDAFDFGDRMRVVRDLAFAAYRLFSPASREGLAGLE